MTINKITAWSTMANDMISNDLHEGALYYFNKILGVDPVNHRAMDGKANMLDILGRVSEALECINDYLERNSSDVYIWILKGDLLNIHHNDCEGAIDCYNQALKINQKREEAWVKKAYTMKEMSKCAEAAACFKTTIELFNESPDLGCPIDYRKCYREYYRELSEEYNNCSKLRGD